jgi:hypothetical protein
MKTLKTFDEAYNLFKEYNYVFFERNVFNLNVFAVRDRGNRIANTYCDDLYVAYHDGEKEVLLRGKCTTVPGTTYLLRPMHSTGAGAIVEGQYLRLWRPGWFRGTRALIQANNVFCYRDKNKDDKYDFDISTARWWGAEAGFFMHESFAGQEPSLVWNSSAGCIVPQQRDYMQRIMSLVDKQRLFLGSDYITFTIFDSRYV